MEGIKFIVQKAQTEIKQKPAMCDDFATAYLLGLCKCYK